jgi:hypothetical protein
MVAAQAAIQLVGAAPASAVAGLERMSALSPTDSASTKTVTAFCPAGKVVTGGGGWAFAVAAADEVKVNLTQLRPVHSTTSRDGYQVTGWETTPAMTGSWWLEAYAICAGAVPGYQLVTATTSASSQARQAAAAVCPTKQAGARLGRPDQQPGGRGRSPGGPHIRHGGHYPG